MHTKVIFIKKDIVVITVYLYLIWFKISPYYQLKKTYCMAYYTNWLNASLKKKL